MLIKSKKDQSIGYTDKVSITRDGIKQTKIVTKSSECVLLKSGETEISDKEYNGIKGNAWFKLLLERKDIEIVEVAEKKKKSGKDKNKS